MKLFSKIKNALNYAFTWLSRDEKKEDTEKDTDEGGKDVPSVPGEITFKDLLRDIDPAALKGVIDGVDKEKLKACIDKYCSNYLVEGNRAALKLIIDAADKEELKRKVDELDEDKKEDGTSEPAKDEAKPVEPKPVSDEPKLNWCWGGFNGSKSTETDKAQIKNLKVSNDKMSYEWAAGGCENLGATSSGDADHTLACLFLDDGRGGKFDWISTSRKTRDFNNIHGGYNGWDANAFKNAKKVWFCICSRNGLVRTNLISATK
jgi:hypothetical protein